MRRTLGTLRRSAALLAAAPRRGSADRWQRAAAGSSVAKNDASETVGGTAAAPSPASRDKRWQRVAQESSPAAEDGPESVGSFIPGVSDDPIGPEVTATVRSPLPRWRPDPSQQRHRRHAPPPKPSSPPPSQQPQQQQRRQPPSASPSSPVLRNRFVAAAMQDDDLRRPSTTTPAPAPIAPRAVKKPRRRERPRGAAPTSAAVKASDPVADVADSVFDQKIELERRRRQASHVDVEYAIGAMERVDPEVPRIFAADQLHFTDTTYRACFDIAAADDGAADDAGRLATTTSPPRVTTIALHHSDLTTVEHDLLNRHLRFIGGRGPDPQLGATGSGAAALPVLSDRSDTAVRQLAGLSGEQQRQIYAPLCLEEVFRSREAIADVTLNEDLDEVDADTPGFVFVLYAENMATRNAAILMERRFDIAGGQLFLSRDSSTHRSVATTFGFVAGVSAGNLLAVNTWRTPECVLRVSAVHRATKAAYDALERCRRSSRGGGQITTKLLRRLSVSAGIAEAALRRTASSPALAYRGAGNKLAARHVRVMHALMQETPHRAFVTFVDMETATPAMLRFLAKPNREAAYRYNAEADGSSSRADLASKLIRVFAAAGSGLAAVLSLPRPVRRSMRIAAEDVAFNAMLSRRHRRLGLAVAVGDLVCTDPGALSGGALTVGRDQVTRVATAAEAANYAITDVVLPLLNPEVTTENDLPLCEPLSDRAELRALLAAHQVEWTFPGALAKFESWWGCEFRDLVPAEQRFAPVARRGGDLTGWCVVRQPATTGSAAYMARCLLPHDRALVAHGVSAAEAARIAGLGLESGGHGEVFYPLRAVMDAAPAAASSSTSTTTSLQLQQDAESDTGGGGSTAVGNGGGVDTTAYFRSLSRFDELNGRTTSMIGNRRPPVAKARESSARSIAELGTFLDDAGETGGSFAPEDFVGQVDGELAHQTPLSADAADVMEAVSVVLQFRGPAPEALLRESFGLHGAVDPELVHVQAMVHHAVIRDDAAIDFAFATRHCKRCMSLAHDTDECLNAAHFDERRKQYSGMGAAEAQRVAITNGTALVLRRDAPGLPWGLKLNDDGELIGVVAEAPAHVALVAAMANQVPGIDRKPAGLAAHLEFLRQRGSSGKQVGGGRTAVVCSSTDPPALTTGGAIESEQGVAEPAVGLVPATSEEPEVATAPVPRKKLVATPAGETIVPFCANGPASTHSLVVAAVNGTPTRTGREVLEAAGAAGRDALTMELVLKRVRRRAKLSTRS